MIMKINEVEGFPKELLKGKTVPLYKAFFFTNSEEEMKINTSIDMLAISKEDALVELINQSPLEDTILSTWSGNTISFAVIKLDKADLLTKDLVDEGDIFFENGIISVTLRDKLYKVDVVDYILRNISIQIDDKTQRRICSDIELVDA